jgi:hypothetical protein
MSKSVRESQIVVSISQPLRDELAVLAAKEGRSLAGFVRRRLVELAARRLTKRKSNEAPIP